MTELTSRPAFSNVELSSTAFPGGPGNTSVTSLSSAAATRAAPFAVWGQGRPVDVDSSSSNHFTSSSCSNVASNLETPRCSAASSRSASCSTVVLRAVNHGLTVTSAIGVPVSVRASRFFSEVATAFFAASFGFVAVARASRPAS